MDVLFTEPGRRRMLRGGVTKSKKIWRGTAIPPRLLRRQAGESSDFGSTTTCRRQLERCQGLSVASSLEKGTSVPVTLRSPLSKGVILADEVGTSSSGRLRTLTFHSTTSSLPCAKPNSMLNVSGWRLWVANYYSARNPLRLSSLVILGVVARMFRCATRSSCWCT